MQARYGCGDNYRAFNGNLGVSFSDVNRDVKSGSQFNPPPVYRGDFILATTFDVTNYVTRTDS